MTGLGPRRLRKRAAIRESPHTHPDLAVVSLTAGAVGLANAWIDRQRLSESGAWGATAAVEERPETDFLFFSMVEMADAVDAEA